MTDPYTPPNWDAVERWLIEHPHPQVPDIVRSAIGGLLARVRDLEADPPRDEFGRTMEDARYAHENLKKELADDLEMWVKALRDPYTG